jgi:DNA recombination protein RmuC
MPPVAALVCQPPVPLYEHPDTRFRLCTDHLFLKSGVTMSFDFFSLLLGPLAGAVLAAGLVYLLLRMAAQEQQGRVAAIQAALETERDSLINQLHEGRDHIATLNVAAADLQERLSGERAARASAEATARRVPDLEARLTGLSQDLTMERRELERLRGDERNLQERLAENRKLLETAQATFRETFQALSHEALSANNARFLELAQAQLEKFQESAKGDLEKRQQSIGELVVPVRDRLEKFDLELKQMEQHRVGAYAELKTQVASLIETQTQLRAETGNLVQALRRPQVRGRWGEIQLKRVVEMAGMLDHCDFFEQQSVKTQDQGQLRPDMIVRLPGGRQIAVDSKVPLEAYLDAHAEGIDEPTRQIHLQRHGKVIREHLKSLGAKNYWQHLGNSTDFVVMFLPESVYAVALQGDPGLIEFGMDNAVIPATPTTLIAVLRAAAYGWRQQALEENARAISALGKELYERIGVVAATMEKLGDALGKATTHYNSAVGSLESRVLVTARRFRDLKAVTDAADIVEPMQRDQAPRQLQAPEFRRPPGTLPD